MADTHELRQACWLLSAQLHCRPLCKDILIYLRLSLSHQSQCALCGGWFEASQVCYHRWLTGMNTLYVLQTPFESPLVRAA